MDYGGPTSLLCSWNSPGKNTGVDSHSLLQGVFPIQGSNPCLLHWQVDSLQLSHQASLKQTPLSKSEDLVGFVQWFISSTPSNGEKDSLWSCTEWEVFITRRMRQEGISKRKQRIILGQAIFLCGERNKTAFIMHSSSGGGMCVGRGPTRIPHWCWSENPRLAH